MFPSSDKKEAEFVLLGSEEIPRTLFNHAEKAKLLLSFY